MLVLSEISILTPPCRVSWHPAPCGDRRRSFKTIRVSHPRKIGVLAHNQPATSARAVPIDADIAELLVRHLAAERISQRLIRMLPRDSVFPMAKFYADNGNYIPDKLPAVIWEGLYREPSASELAVISVVPRTHYLPRFREVFGDRQLEISL